jgi:hypothetical protein
MYTVSRILYADVVKPSTVLEMLYAELAVMHAVENFMTLVF